MELCPPQNAEEVVEIKQRGLLNGGFTPRLGIVCIWKCTSKDV